MDFISWLSCQPRRFPTCLLANFGGGLHRYCTCSFPTSFGGGLHRFSKHFWRFPSKSSTFQGKLFRHDKRTMYFQKLLVSLSYLFIIIVTMAPSMQSTNSNSQISLNGRYDTIFFCFKKHNNPKYRWFTEMLNTIYSTKVDDASTGSFLRM